MEILLVRRGVDGSRRGPIANVVGDSAPIGDAAGGRASDSPGVVADGTSPAQVDCTTIVEPEDVISRMRGRTGSPLQRYDRAAAGAARGLRKNRAARGAAHR